MKFTYKGMYIHRDWLEVIYQMAGASFDVVIAKQICKAFEDDEIGISRITTSYEEDLSDTSSFFDSYTQHCCVERIDELDDHSWDGTFQADFLRHNSSKKEKPVLSISSRKYSSELSILFDNSQYKLPYIPAAADDRELSLDELVESLKGDPNATEDRSFETAVAMVKSEWYDDAYQLLHKIGRDKEAATLLPRDYQQRLAFEKGVMLREKEKYEDAIASFSKATDMKQAKEEIQETVYRQALQRLKQQNYREAFDLLVEVIEYKDARQLLQNAPLSKVNNENMSKRSKVVLFGRNGDLPIPWIVLESKDGQALLLSKHPLWCDSFHDTYVGVEWERSSLCRKLNTVFKKEAFSFEEMSQILPNNDPVNRISLLDKDIQRYVDSISMPFTKNDALIFKSLDNGSHRFSTVNCWWLKNTKDPEPRAYRVLELPDEKRVLDEGVRCPYWVRPVILIRAEKKRTFFGF